MKRYLTYVTLFLLIVGTILALWECFVRQYPTSYQYKAQWMDSHAPSVSTLVLGGSHTYYGVMPSLMGDSVFNLANVTQHSEIDDWLLSHYIDRCTNLKTVIVPVDVTNTFDSPLEKSVEWYRGTYYKLYMGCDLFDNNLKYYCEISCLPAFNRKFLAAVQGLCGGDTSLECDSTGFGTGFATPSHFDENMMIVSAKTAEHRSTADSANVAYNSQHLMHIASMCHDRGIRLVIVTTPMWDGYTSRISKASLETVHGIVNQCVKKYGAVYMDHMNDTRFQGTDFYDCDHLSRQGAEKFTRILNEQLAR